jgi:hypothetical protein
MPILPLQINLSLGDPTSHQALLNAFRNASWDRSLELLHIRTIDSLAEGRRHHIGAHSKEFIRDLASAEVLIVESGDKCSIYTVRVELRVDASLVERLHLELVDGVGDDSAAIGSVVVPKYSVLGKHLSHHSSLSNDLQFDTAGVDVRSVESAGPEKPDCHSGTCPY